MNGRLIAFTSDGGSRDFTVRTLGGSGESNTAMSCPAILFNFTPAQYRLWLCGGGGRISKLHFAVTAVEAVEQFDRLFIRLPPLLATMQRCQ